MKFSAKHIFASLILATFQNSSVIEATDLGFRVKYPETTFPPQFLGDVVTYEGAMIFGPRDRANFWNEYSLACDRKSSEIPRYGVLNGEIVDAQYAHGFCQDRIFLCQSNTGNSGINTHWMECGKQANINLPNGWDATGAYAPAGIIQDAHLPSFQMWNGNLADSNLNRAFLENARIHYVSLFNVDITGANLSNANLSYSDIDLHAGLLVWSRYTSGEYYHVPVRTNLRNLLITDSLVRLSCTGCDLQGSNFTRIKGNSSIPGDTRKSRLGLSFSDMTDGSLDRSDFRGSSFNDSGMARLYAVGANLEGTWFNNSILDDANFANANLKSSRFTVKTSKKNYRRRYQPGNRDIGSGSLRRAYFLEANLTDAYFGEEYGRDNFDASGAIFVRASLRNAAFVNTNLSGANFWEADLQDAGFRGSDLRGTNLIEALSLKGARYDSTTLLPFSDEVARSLGMIKY